MSKRVLVTGFEPFGGDRINPSASLAQNLAGRQIAGRLIVTAILPVDRSRVEAALMAALDEWQPEILIGTGVAAGRPALALERVALNLLDFDQPDNAGSVPRGEPIEPGGPAARLGTLPAAEVTAAWGARGIPGYLSNTAGTYVCNQMMYLALAYRERRATPPAAGFIHLPLLPEQALERGAERTPSMSPALMLEGLEIAIAATVRWLGLSRALSEATQQG